jgi:hypothetical protein
MFDSPRIWARSTAKSLRSIIDPNVTGRMMNNPENFKAATEFVQGGGTMGHLSDFMSGANPGQLATKIPYLRQVVERSGRAFGTFQDMAKLEMWKAVRDTVPKEEWPDAIEQIENLGLSGKMETAGMSHARSVGERILFMAPAYYRGAVNLVASAAEGVATGRVSGKMATKALAKYAAGMTLSMVGAYLAAGMSWEEIRHRLTPGQKNEKFLKFPVKIGDDTIEVGPGGIMLSLMNLGTDVAVTTATDPKKMATMGTDNPFIKWTSSRLGPLPGLARKIATGEDVFGRKTGPVGTALSAATPIAAQKFASAARSSNKAAGAAMAAGAFVGLDTNKVKASTDVYDMAQKFMKSQGLKKESGFDEVANDEPSYSKLRSAVSAGSQSRFNDIYKSMTESRTHKDLLKTMREWRDSPFTGSKHGEKLFRSALTPYQEKLYDQAQDERDRVYEKFLDMMDEAP